MTISPGIGGSIGGPPTPTVDEQQRTAATVVAQTRWGIVASTEDLCMTQMGTYIRWKYDCNAGNPSIPMLNRFRVMQRAQNQVDKVWITAFEKMLEKIKEDVREALIKEAQLPPEMRNPAYGALDRTLGWLAQGMIWLDNVSPMENNEATLFGQAATSNSLQQGMAIVQEAEAALNEIGHQSPYFDLLSQSVADLKEVITNMQEDRPYASRGG